MMLLLPIGDDIRLHRPPLVTLALIVGNVAIFGWMMTMTPGEEGRLIHRFGLIAARLIGGAPGIPDAAPAWVTLFTCAFIHGGLLHLFGNMLFLWIFGGNVEEALGIVRFLLFYLLCAALAGITQALVAPRSPVPMIGASGAIAGVLAAYWALYPGAMVRVFFWFIVLVRTFLVPASWWILFWLAGQIWSAWITPPGRPGVAWYAHLGGFFGGVVLLFAVFPHWLEARRDWLRRRGW